MFKKFSADDVNNKTQAKQSVVRSYRKAIEDHYPSLKDDLDATGTNRDHYVVNIHVEDHQDFIAAMYQEAEDLGDN